MADDDKTKNRNTDLEKFTDLDPEKLPEELKSIYKSMQADYTRKTQAIADLKKDFAEKETEFQDKLKSFGAVEQEVKQWRDWYKQLEEQATGDDKTGDLKNDDLDLTKLDDSDTNAGLVKLIKGIEQKIADLEGELASVSGSVTDSRNMTNRMFNYQAQLDELTGKYSSVDKKKVLDHALKTGQTNLEKAYRDLYQDDIIQAEVDRRLEEERKKDRASTGIKTPGQKIVVRSSEGTPKTFAEASEQILKQMSGS